MDQRQALEIADRRRAQTQIDELKRNCEQFVRERDTLSKKLSELNEIVDKLIYEKKTNKYDSSWKIDLKPYFNITSPESTKPSSSPSNYHWNQLPSSINRNNDLISDNNHDNLSLFHREQNSNQKTPSDAFKIKLFHCLQEIEQKAEEISKLSEHLYP